MIYDPVRKVMVLVTWDYTENVKTWEFNGTDWILLQPMSIPSHVSNTMVFNTDKNITILFGGVNGPNWVWDGNNWKEVGIDGYPVSYLGGPVIYDIVRNSLISFSGFGTWEYKDTNNTDLISPTTTISLDPSDPNGQNGWYLSNILIKVIATDNIDGSGVAETRCVLSSPSIPLDFYDLPSGCPYIGEGNDLIQDGQHTIYLASIDNAGNKEKLLSKQLDINMTLPIITTITTNSNNTPYSAGIYTNQTVTVHFTCTNSISGVMVCPEDQSFSSDGIWPLVTGTVINNAGNSLKHQLWTNTNQ